MIKNEASLNKEVYANKIELKEILNRLNDKQKQAVQFFDGPLLILAGAGSGKTTVVVNKIAWLLSFFESASKAESPLAGIKPWQVLAITFTNKAAKELCERLHSLLGEQGRLVNAGTFHSQCVKILARHIDRLGFDPKFVIYDTADCRRLLQKEVFEILKINSKVFQPKNVLYEISKAKNSFLEPAQYRSMHKDDYYKSEIGRIYECYQNVLKKLNGLDFDDIIFLTVRLLEQNRDVLEFYQNKFKYIFVDEYQDTNRVQFKLIKLLIGERSSLCVVGDDDQSIYRFRGAAIENILNFEKSLANVKIIRLEQNYRSTGNILSAANNIISHNAYRNEKTIWTENCQGDKVEQIELFDENDEAAFVCSTIEEGVKNGLKFCDHAVLYRTNAQSATIERHLVRRAIPYQIIGSKKFYELKEVKDMIAYLSVVNNPNDDFKLLRIINEPKRGIGTSSIEKLQKLAQQQQKSIFEIISNAESYVDLGSKQNQLKKFAQLIGFLRLKAQDCSISQLFDEIIECTGFVDYLKGSERFEQRFENLKELKTNLIHFENENEQASLQNFLSEIALYTDLDEVDSSEDRIVLMTLHSAKGLEFPVVFMTGMEEELFPSAKSCTTQQDLEEERRLAYVGVTRAMKKLYLTHVSQRMIFGSTKTQTPSRFLAEIPSHCKHVKTRAFESKLNSAMVRPRPAGCFDNVGVAIKRKPAKSSQLFAANDVVLHPVFGKGDVLLVTPLGDDFLIEIVFEKVGKKKVMANYAKLKKI